eukprot:299573_1
MNNLKCVCSNDLILTTTDIYGPQTTVYCNKCKHQLPLHTIIFHCPLEKIYIHPNAYDICYECTKPKEDDFTFVSMKKKLTGSLNMLWFSSLRGNNCYFGLLVEILSSIMNNSSAKKCFDINTKALFEKFNNNKKAFDAFIQTLEQCGFVQIENESLLRYDISILNINQIKHGRDVVLKTQRAVLEFNAREDITKIRQKEIMAQKLKKQELERAHKKLCEMRNIHTQCICGGELMPMLVKDAYEPNDKEPSIGCDSCYGLHTANEVIFHCPHGKSKSSHPSGYDTCCQCAVQNGQPACNDNVKELIKLGYSERKSVIMLNKTKGDLAKAKQLFEDQKQKKIQMEKELHELFGVGDIFHLLHPEVADGTKNTACFVDNECKINTCVALKQLIVSIKNYSQDTWDNVDMSQIVNDFLHLIYIHDDDQQFEFIVNKLGFCNLSECKKFTRHYINRSKSVSCSVIDFHEQIMDKIHCYYHHSYDIGYRLSRKDRSTIYLHESKIDDEKNDQFKQFTVNKCNSTTQFTEFICNKQKMYKKIDGLRNLSPEKFNQFMLNADTVGHDHKYYSFGTEFQYGLNEVIVDEVETDNADIVAVIRPVPIKNSKYSNLKEEMTKNAIYNLNVSQFNAELKKAKIHLNTAHCKQIYHNMDLDKLLSLMIYCNYDSLQREFSRTYRKIDTQETTRSLINRHQNFYHLGKNLKIVINKMGDLFKFYLYHGITHQLVFPAYLNNVIINGPLSTTKSKEIAVHFATNSGATNSGIIVQFEPSRTKKEYKYAGLCFPVAWISDYPNEQEHLFVQCQGTLWISNIIDVRSGKEYRIILKSLAMMDSAGESAFVTFVAQEIIDHQLSKTFVKSCESLNSLDKYAQEIINVYCRNQTYVHISYWSEVFKVFRNSKCQWINLELIHVLFPNIEKIHLIAVNLCKFSVDYLYDYLKLPLTKASNLQLIWIKPMKNSNWNVLHVISTYKQKFEQINFIMFKVQMKNFLCKDPDSYYLCLQKIGSNPTFMKGKTIYNTPQFGINAYYNPCENKTTYVTNSLK